MWLIGRDGTCNSELIIIECILKLDTNYRLSKDILENNAKLLAFVQVVGSRNLYLYRHLLLANVIRAALSDDSYGYERGSSLMFL